MPLANSRHEALLQVAFLVCWVPTLADAQSFNGPNNQGLSGGVIAAIVVGVVLAIIVKITIIVCLCRYFTRRRTMQRQMPVDTPPVQQSQVQPGLDQQPAYNRSTAAEGYDRNSQEAPPAYTAKQEYAAPAGAPPNVKPKTQGFEQV